MTIFVACGGYGLPKNALGKGGKAGLVKCSPARGAPATRSGVVTGPRTGAPLTVAASDSPEVEVLPAIPPNEQRLYELALARVYAIPQAEQEPEMVALLASVCDRLDQLSCIGKYAGQLPPRNSTAVHNALKTRIILTFGPQVQRSQKAVVQETRKEIIVRHIHVGGGEKVN